MFTKIALVWFALASASLSFAGNKSMNPANALEPAFPEGITYKTNPTGLDDRTFLRRVWLDLAGTLPSPSHTEAFVARNGTKKYAEEIDKLLASEAFTERWTTFLGDIFQNHALIEEYPYWRNAFHDNLRSMVASNVPWDEMARRILTGNGKGVNPNASFFFWARESLEENYRLDYLDDQTALITDTMLGVQTLCISCHDGANHLEEVNVDLTSRKRQEFWSMAALVAPTYMYLDPVDYGTYPGDEDENAEFRWFLQNLRVIDMDQPGFNPQGGELIPVFDSEEYRAELLTGEYVADSQAGQGMRPPRKGGTVAPAYMFTGETPQPGETRRQALARMITADRQFSRNMINRVWAHFFGKGFVEPMNGWDLARLDEATAAANNATAQPLNPPLVEFLTDWFINNDYDMRALVRVIANSKLYQWDYAANPPGQGAAFENDPWATWRDNSRVKRLDAESIIDNMYQALGMRPSYHVSLKGTQTFNSAWQMPGPAEPGFYALADLYLTDDYEIKPGVNRQQVELKFLFAETAQTLLENFGRGDYFNGIVRTNEDNIQNALTLMNDYLVNIYMDAPDAFPNVRKWANDIRSGQLSNSQFITDIYRQTLFRDPTEQERSVLEAHISNLSPEQAVVDSLWILFNMPDFLYR